MSLLSNSTTNSRKRRSETVLSAESIPVMEGYINSTNMLLQQQQQMATTVTAPGPRLRVRIRRFHGVARWTWNAGSDDEVCGICQSAFEGVAPVPGVKYPGDECPVVWGKCGHAFHLQCVSTWLNSSRNTCPICRREWEFGQSNDVPQRRANTTAGTNNMTE